MVALSPQAAAEPHGGVHTVVMSKQVVVKDVCARADDNTQAGAMIATIMKLNRLADARPDATRRSVMVCPLMAVLI